MGRHWQKTKKRGFLFSRICTLLLVITLSGCAVNPVTGKQELMLVSESQEVEMGKSFYPNALWGDLGGGGEYYDPQLTSYLRAIVLRIHGVSHRSNLPVDFAIQNSSVPNAWAIPGHVAITRGLLAGLANEAEFVFVMGHEMGHVSARHSARHMSYGMVQQAGLGAAGIALSNRDYGDLALGLGAFGSSLLLLKYSRDDELEADRIGIQYMAALGYDPRYALSAHRNLEKISQEYLKTIGKSPTERGFVEDLFSTHPRTSVRIDELQQIIASERPRALSGDGANQAAFQNATAGIRNTHRIYTDHYDRAVTAFQNEKTGEAESLVSRAINADPRQPAFHALLGYVRVRQKSFDEADRHFITALGIRNDYEPAFRGRGIVRYGLGQYDESLSFLQRSLELYPQDVPAHYFAGMANYRMRRCEQALPHLSLFADAQQQHPEVHGILGICYESRKDLAKAYREYQLQQKVAPNSEMGKHAAERAAALKPAVERPPAAR